MLPCFIRYTRCCREDVVCCTCDCSRVLRPHMRDGHLCAALPALCSSGVLQLLKGLAAHPCCSPTHATLHTLHCAQAMRCWGWWWRRQRWQPAASSAPSVSVWPPPAGPAGPAALLAHPALNFGSLAQGVVNPPGGSSPLCGGLACLRSAGRCHGSSFNKKNLGPGGVCGKTPPLLPQAAAGSWPRSLRSPSERPPSASTLATPGTSSAARSRTWALDLRRRLGAR